MSQSQVARDLWSDIEFFLLTSRLRKTRTQRWR